MTKIFLFGATGDLSIRKLYPALYELFSRDRLPSDTEIICISRRPYDKDAFLDFLISNVGGTRDVKKWFEFIKKLTYFSLEFPKLEDYVELKKQVDGDKDSVNIFYLATAPQFFKPIVEHLSSAGLLEHGNLNNRIVFEKPFGKNLQTAKEINEHLSQYVVEDQIYRMDHYLGKEMIQNIMMLRFSNMIYEASWNKDYIDHIQITVAESVGVLERAEYYDQAGAIRDMIQSHLLQMLSLVALTPSGKLDSRDILKSKTEVLKALYIEDVKRDVIIGQYSGDGKVKAYREEKGVAPDSCTETYAAMKLKVDLPRWEGVDFYLRTGKSLEKKVSEIAIVYKCPDVGNYSTCPQNVMVIEIYPQEGMRFKFNMKKPGEARALVTREMEFCQSCMIDYSAPEAYETLIHEVVSGNHDLFTRWDEVWYEWVFVEKMLSECQNLQQNLRMYAPGSKGPKEADELLARDGRQWYSL